jgi:hypothetical protein
MKTILHRLANRTERPTEYSRFLGFAFLVAALNFVPPTLCAQEQNSAQSGPAVGQRTFASPDEAVNALKAATESHDKSALRQLFGPEYDKLQTGDQAQDERNAQKFVAAVAQSCKAVPDGNDTVTIEVGTNAWPMPIPLVKSDGQWHFDTDAGKEEIIARHIGKDELHAIGVCRAFVKAQQQFASQNGGASASYATSLKSASLSQEVSDADLDDAVNSTQPYHGYFFRVLTRQGEAAPGGKKNYIRQGALSGGFALVAFPARWDQSGIMTFIVNQDGNVYERNFGEKSFRIARRMKTYNPDNNWKLAQDEGMFGAVSEKNTQ